MPVVDALGRYPGNNFYPRIVSSLASQFCDGNPAVEAIGGAGWGLTPKDFEIYMLWLISHGINNIILHINQYKLKSEAIRDWPASIPCYVTWKDVFPTVIKKLKFNNFHINDTLVISPTRGVMANFTPKQVLNINRHDGSNQPNTKSTQISKSIVDFCEILYECNVHFKKQRERSFYLYNWKFYC